MIEYFVAICILLLTIGHGIFIHGWLKWGSERTAFSTMLDGRLAMLATLIDEGLDMANGDVSASAPMGTDSIDVRAMLTAALMSKLMPDPEHGSTQGQEGAIHEDNDTPLEETEV